MFCIDKNTKKSLVASDKITLIDMYIQAGTKDIYLKSFAISLMQVFII